MPEEPMGHLVCQRPKVRGGFGAGKGEMEVGAAPQARASVHGVFAVGEEVGDVAIVLFVGSEDQGYFLAFDWPGDQVCESAEDLPPDVLEGLPGPFDRRLIRTGYDEKVLCFEDAVARAELAADAADPGQTGGIPRGFVLRFGKGFLDGCTDGLPVGIATRLGDMQMGGDAGRKFHE